MATWGLRTLHKRFSEYDRPAKAKRTNTGFESANSWYAGTCPDCGKQQGIYDRKGKGSIKKACVVESCDSEVELDEEAS